MDNVTDIYRKFLAHARWTWNEYGRVNHPKRNKDRVMGRMEKRSARAIEKKEWRD